MRQVSHEEACTEKRCARGCEWAAFHERLERPLPWLAHQVRQRELEQQRLAALMKGEIPEAV